MWIRSLYCLTKLFNLHFAILDKPSQSERDCVILIWAPSVWKSLPHTSMTKPKRGEAAPCRVAPQFENHWVTLEKPNLKSLKTDYPNPTCHILCSPIHVGFWSLLLLRFTQQVLSLSPGYPISSVYLHIHWPVALFNANEYLLYVRALPLLS